MKKILLFLIPALMIVAGAVYLFTYKKPETTQPVTETEGIQTSITSEIPVPRTTTPETLVTHETLDLSKYKTPIMIIDQKKTYTAKMKTSAGGLLFVLDPPGPAPQSLICRTDMQ